MRHTIEEKMMELKRRKLKLYQAILESPSAGSRLPITKEDFDYLLSATGSFQVLKGSDSEVNSGQGLGTSISISFLNFRTYFLLHPLKKNNNIDLSMKQKGEKSRCHP